MTLPRLTSLFAAALLASAATSSALAQSSARL